MKRRAIVASAVVVVFLLFPALLPEALSHVAFFRIRQVELIGVRHHSPNLFVQELNLEPDRNLFDSLREIEERAQELPGVVFAKAKRRMPGTLTIEVGERVPVAFVPTSTGMLAVDAEAHPLAYDPAATGLDLPIVPRADSVLVRALATVLVADSALYGLVNGARFGDGDAVILELGSIDVILRREPTTDEIRAVGLVRRHLTATERPYDELDVRFKGRVIVRGSGA